MTRRAAIYARFSTDLQHDRSIDDQFLVCRRYAEKNGLTVVVEYHDKARSGATIIGREGIADLMCDADARRFDVIIVEELDRLSRDQADLAQLFKLLSFLGIHIETLHEGRADHVKVGIRGLLGSLFLQDLAHKVRRGLDGRVAEGKLPGGKGYGYAPIPGSPGDAIIVEAEANVIRRIYVDFVGGKSCRTICHELNAEGVPPPRGTFWRASTLTGSQARGYGILRNELYGGRLVWNRVRMVRDPSTGKRVSRENPTSEWRYHDVPHLRIVPDDLLEAARARFQVVQPRQKGTARKRRLLTGLLRCEACGSPMAVHGLDHGRTRIICTRHKEAGTCSNGRRYYLDVIENLAVEAMQTAFDKAGVMDEIVHIYIDERKRLAGEASRNRGTLEGNLLKAEAEKKRLVDMYCKELVDEAYVRTEMPLRDKAIADAKLALNAATPAPLIDLRPKAIELYREAIEMLRTSISRQGISDDLPPEVFRTVREALGCIVVKPTPAGTSRG